jgi:hypothetical protein
MGTRCLTALATVALVFGVAGLGAAQVDDHLKCYKIKDDIKLKGLVDLDSKQFGLEPGCKIGNAKLFCVPVTKSNVQVTAKNKAGIVNPLPIFGPPAPGDRICYKVKCPDPRPPDTTASDQFGTHNLTKFKAFMLCTPAGKFTPPPTPCDLSGYPSCGGDCPLATQTCHPANDGTTKCLCNEPCGFDANGICGGDCADATDICQLNTLTGKCDCGPVQQQCEDFPSGQGLCGGPCPPNFVCDDDAPGLACKCFPQFDCGDPVLDPQCQGFCPAPMTCVTDPVQGCNCQ